MGGICSDKLTIFSELDQEKYVPHARDRIGQLQTSAQQPSLAKPFAVIQSKLVPSLSWLGVVTQMAYGQGETVMKSICSLQVFPAIATVQEKSKKRLSEVRSLIQKNLNSMVRKMNRYTRY